MTGYNKAFIIDNETKEALIKENPKSAELIKPVLRGEDIKRYGHNWEKTKYWLIATFPSLKIDIDHYPAIRKYLLSFGKERLEQAGKILAGGGKSRKKTNHDWYELQDTCAYHAEFEKGKIVWGNIAYNSSFTLLEKGIYISAPCNMITSSNVNLKYLLGCLNSKIFNYEFRQVGIFLGKAFEWKKQYVEQIHIPENYSSKKSLVENIETLVDKILMAKKHDINSNTLTTEKEIDQLIYKMYDLNKEEIQLVENNE